MGCFGLCEGARQDQIPDSALSPRCVPTAPLCAAAAPAGEEEEAEQEEAPKKDKKKKKKDMDSLFAALEADAGGGCAVVARLRGQSGGYTGWWERCKLVISHVR